MVRELHLAGVSVTGANVVDQQQVLNMTAAVFPRRERGRARLPPGASASTRRAATSRACAASPPSSPTSLSAGLAIAADRRLGRRVTRAAALTTGLELRRAGLHLGVRARSGRDHRRRRPDDRRALAVDGPRPRGAGGRRGRQGLRRRRRRLDGQALPRPRRRDKRSHDTLPVLDSTLEELMAHDLPPFESAIRQQAPAVMLSHLDLTDIAPGVPASMAPEVYDLLRDDLGFEGVAITDSLGMGAVGGRPTPALQALQAGADLLLMPVDNATTHQIVVDAIDSGVVSRARVEEAAARVVALQMWQARIAAQRPVPADVVDRARAASADLESAAY